MAITVRCGACGTRYRASESTIGKRLKCAKCGKTIHVTGDAGTAATASGDTAGAQETRADNAVPPPLVPRFEGEEPAWSDLLKTVDAEHAGAATGPRQSKLKLMGWNPMTITLVGGLGVVAVVAVVVTAIVVFGHHTVAPPADAKKVAFVTNTDANGDSKTLEVYIYADQSRHVFVRGTHDGKLGPYSEVTGDDARKIDESLTQGATGSSSGEGSTPSGASAPALAPPPPTAEASPGATAVVAAAPPAASDTAVVAAAAPDTTPTASPAPAPAKAAANPAPAPAAPKTASGATPAAPPPAQKAAAPRSPASIMAARRRAMNNLPASPPPSAEVKEASTPGTPSTGSTAPAGATWGAAPAPAGTAVVLGGSAPAAAGATWGTGGSGATQVPTNHATPSARHVATPATPTTASAPITLDQAVKVLETGGLYQKIDALKSLGHDKPPPNVSPTDKGQMVNAIQPMLQADELLVKELAMTALVNWAGHDAVPDLLPFLSGAQAPALRLQAIMALAPLKDARAIDPIANLVVKGDALASYLDPYGAAAEDAWLRILQQSPDDQTTEGIGKLAVKYGTHKSQVAFQAIADDPQNPEHAIALDVADALQKKLAGASK